MEKTRILIDCDPGHDDALAILWALSSDMLEVRGITTVAGNKSLEKVTGNAIKVLTRAGCHDIPVAAGSARPILNRGLGYDSAAVHGDSGLEVSSPTPMGFSPSPLRALELMEKVLEEDVTTIVALGPLTNVALLLLTRPDLKSRIEKISLMGGGTFGNRNPACEFNIFADPEAARVVFESGVPIIMSALDVTTKAYITLEESSQLRALGGNIPPFAADLIDFYAHYSVGVEGFPGATLHDPCAIAVLLHPEIFSIKMAHVDVETSGGQTAGMTLIDTLGDRRQSGGRGEMNVSFLYDVDRPRFASLFMEAMRSLG